MVTTTHHVLDASLAELSAPVMFEVIHEDASNHEYCFPHRISGWKISAENEAILMETVSGTGRLVPGSLSAVASVENQGMPTILDKR